MVREPAIRMVDIRDYQYFFAHFPCIGSDDPPLPPLGIENVKIQENSEKIRGPLGTLYNSF